MSKAAQEVISDMQQQRQMRLQSDRVMNGLTTGVALLEDKIVVAPIAMHEGLTDLKWILTNLLKGQFALNLDPEGRPKTPAKEPSPEDQE